MTWHASAAVRWLTRHCAVMALPQFPLGVDPIRLQRVADAMQQFGLLKSQFNVGQMIG